MTRSSNALDVLVAEIDKHVAVIEKDSGTAACPAHRSIADGIVLLLRIRKAEYGSEVADRREARSAMIAAGFALAVSALQGLGVVLWGMHK